MCEQPVAANIDPVAVLFENLYFALDSEVAKKHLNAFLAEETKNRAWVLRILIDGCVRVKISKPRLKALLLERIEPWEWETSAEFIGDISETFARLWPADELNLASTCPVDWSRIEKRLCSAQGSQIESALAEVLSSLHEPSRWLLVSLFLRRTDWGLLRQDVFEVVDDLSAMDAGCEAYWYFLKERPGKLESLLSGGSSDLGIEKGASFRVAERPVSMNWEDVLKLNPEDYQYTSCVGGEWVQCCASKFETNLYGSNGELLNAGFSDLLDSACATGSCTAVLHSKGRSQELLEKRLLAAKQKRRFKNIDGNTEPIELTLLKGDPLFAAGDQSLGFRVIYASWSAVGSWDGLNEIPTERLLLQRKQKGDPSVPARVKVIAPARKVLVAFLYAEKSRSTMGYSSFTVGLQNAAGQWLPLAKVDSQDLGLLEVDRFEDWVKANVTIKRGPIVEFRKELVMEISFTGVVSAPRRKCGLNLENPMLKRIVWENRVEDLPILEDFVPNRE